jgi:hypothetical protein
MTLAQFVTCVNKKVTYVYIYFVNHFRYPYPSMRRLG